MQSLSSYLTNLDPSTHWKEDYYNSREYLDSLDPSKQNEQKARIEANINEIGKKIILNAEQHFKNAIWEIHFGIPCICCGFAATFYGIYTQDIYCVSTAFVLGLVGGLSLGHSLGIHSVMSKCS